MPVLEVAAGIYLLVLARVLVASLGGNLTSQMMASEGDLRPCILTAEGSAVHHHPLDDDPHRIQAVVARNSVGKLVRPDLGLHGGGARRNVQRFEMLFFPVGR